MHRCLWFLLCCSMAVGQSALEKVSILINQKKYKEAQTAVQDYLKDNPKNYKAKELLGDAYAYQRKWDEAIAQYENLIETYPKSADYNYKYGGALAMKAQSGSKIRALGLIGDMKRAFLKAVSLDSMHIDAHWALVDMYVTLPGIVGGSYTKALKYASRLEQISAVDGYLAKGYVYEYDDEPELAEKYYKLAIKVGGSITCYNKLSDFYTKQQKPEHAIGTYEKAHQKLQRNAIHYQIGKVCADYNIQLEKGEKCLNTYIANHSAKDGVPVEWAYFRLAQIYRHKNNRTEALNYIDKALDIRKDFKQALSEKELILKL